MSSSFKKINYSLRPAKAVERKMLSSALKKLSHFGPLNEYVYVGMGSTFFNDFINFHKDLGIIRMISMENSGNKKRFDFNKPFHCIEMKYGDSHTILPSIDWSKKTILWLDYDKILNKEYLSDVATFFSSACSGSTFLITINCEPTSYGDSNSNRRQRLIETVGEDNLPFGNKLSHFSAKEFPLTIYKIILQLLQDTLDTRNGGLVQKEKLFFKQLFHFRYADGAKMLTLGGIIFDEKDQKVTQKVNFKEYEFITEGETHFQIDVPSLTPKEIRFLNSQLPGGIDRDGNILGPELPDIVNPNLHANDVKKYAKIYSYFPFYTEAFSI